MKPNPDAASPEKRKTDSRRYPARYERLVPLALGLIAVLMLALLVVTLVILAGS